MMVGFQSSFTVSLSTFLKVPAASITPGWIFFKKFSIPNFSKSLNLNTSTLIGVIERVYAEMFPLFESPDKLSGYLSIER